MRNSPMMVQYFSAKEQHPDCLVLFRMGDFYEVFFDDAVTVARALDLTLTARGRDSGAPIPMAGVPYQTIDGYVRRLVEQGHRVALCDQLDDPSTTARGIVRRGVTRVFSPGVLTDEAALDARQNNFLAALAMSSVKHGDVTTLAYLDVSTGELCVTEIQAVATVTAELRRVSPAEVLVAGGQAAVLTPLARQAGCIVTERHDRALSLVRAVAAAEGGVLAVAAIGQTAACLSPAELQARIATLDRETVRDRESVEAALALLFDYVIATQGGVPRLVGDPRLLRADAYMVLDPATAANLEIFQTTMHAKRRGSLVGVLDETVTSPGARRLRTWLAFPLLDLTEIRRRHGAVSVLVDRLESRSRLREELRACADIQRLAGRVSGGQGSAREICALGRTLARIPALRALLAELDDATLAHVLERLDPCAELCTHIGRALLDELPNTVIEGGMFRRGYVPALDELLDAGEDAKGWLLAYERSEQSRTGIASLKVGFNRVFGYYLEVTNPKRELVPADYIRKQTLANAERYFTAELKEREDLILHGRERRERLEYELYEALRAEVIAALGRLRSSAEAVADLDVLCGLAELAHTRRYCCPEMVEEPVVDIVAGRHPVVEAVGEDGRFVPNDTRLAADQRVLIITGPNMAGKSTVIRQVALIALLAQIGSHVPAESARLGVVDQIFSRVGASDNLARGQSTFMVEMSETAHILARATERSLVVLDEIGRGTSTYDGLSIAWAVAEHLHDAVGALTLFATHYHELTALSRTRDAVRNYNIAVREWNEDIVFLHRLVAGPANRSYGIQVARLAGVPKPVVDRAREVLRSLESDEGVSSGDPPRPRRAARRQDTSQLDLFGPAPERPSPLVGELSAIALETMSPIDALNYLFSLRERARALG